MKVEIWSDVVCPWCYIGKRRFEAALARFPHRDEVEVVWKAFELDPSAPPERAGDLTEHLATKYGVSRAQAQAMHDRMTETAAAEGLTYRFDLARTGSSFDAHRLSHLAAQRGLQDAVVERLFAAYLSEGEPIGDRATLVRLAAEAGLDTEEARDVLEGDGHADAVRRDEAEASALGITGVPFFVVDRRYGVSGAQPVEALAEVLQRAWDDAHALTVVGAGASPGAGHGEGCSDGSCTV